ncbi:MAG: xanthine dehydrogenase family protein subunit M [Williamsia sp.]|nr:xanthine dehydrogenase family protein subunit M [Williamsia sp.]
MHPFLLTQAQNNQSAVKALAANNKSKLIAGGTNLVDLMKMYVESPEELIDINALELKKIEPVKGGGIRIGALASNTDAAYHPAVMKQYPVLSQALLSGASAQLRNMATVGGNLMQRTRCPYFFNDSFPCNKRVPGSGCSAIPGYNRMHAVLGTSDKCIATHPSDMCVALAALDALVKVQGPAGERTIPIREFHVLPGDTPHIETRLQHDELITAVEIPLLPFATHSHYLKVRDRASYEFALASAAVALDVSGNTIRAARIALGGVGTKPWRAEEAEKVLTGAPNTTPTYQLAATAALKEAKGYKYNTFKIELAKRTLVRALATAGGIS